VSGDAGELRGGLVTVVLAAVLVAGLVVPRTAAGVASRFTDAAAAGGNSFSTAADFTVA